MGGASGLCTSTTAVSLLVKMEQLFLNKSSSICWMLFGQLSGVHAFLKYYLYQLELFQFGEGPWGSSCCPSKVKPKPLVLDGTCLPRALVCLGGRGRRVGTNAGTSTLELQNYERH